MPGFTGEDCMTQLNAIDRKDFGSLSTIDKQYVMDAFRLAKTVSHPYQAYALVILPPVISSTKYDNNDNNNVQYIGMCPYLIG
jgi:hypothetical protein